MNRDSSHLIGGRSNHSPLTETGINQSGFLGQRFLADNIKFDRVYSSTAVRAYQTAKIACEKVQYPIENIILSEEILELNQGDWEGKNRSEIYTKETLELIKADNWNFIPPNGESQRAVEYRMLNWLEKSLFTNEDLIVSVYTHGVAIKCLLRGIMDFTPKLTYKICLDNTSITRLQYKEDGWHLFSINDIAHLF